MDTENFSSNLLRRGRHHKTSCLACEGRLGRRTSPCGITKPVLQYGTAASSLPMFPWLCIRKCVTGHTCCTTNPTHPISGKPPRANIFKVIANSSPALEKNMWYFHLTRYNKLNTLPPTLQQSVSYSTHIPMILLLMTSQDRGSQSKRLTLLESKVGIIKRGLMACGHKLQSGSKNPQDIPPWHSPISKVVKQKPHVCLFLQPRNAARTHKHIQDTRKLLLE